MADDFARRLATGSIGPQEIERLRRGCAAWLAAGGAVPLERCLGLPGTPAQVARDERDTQLFAAWQLVDGETPWKRSVVLADELKAFQARVWPLWRREAAPPAGSSDLRKSLFLALRAADRAGIAVPETARQLHNIARGSAK